MRSLVNVTRCSVNVKFDLELIVHGFDVESYRTVTAFSRSNDDGRSARRLNLPISGTMALELQGVCRNTHLFIPISCVELRDATVIVTVLPMSVTLNSTSIE